ncbi:MAG: DinB family protein [Anaerolineales bacterium]|nr:DinB family protein [Anaerolineales bacterium]
MRLDIGSIRDPQVQTFYSMWWPQHQIIYDFYTRLTEEQFGYRMVDTPGRKSDTPRESLAHILYVQLVYLNGVKTGKLEFKSMGVEHYCTMTKDQLLVEMRRIDEEMFAHLTAETFDSHGRVEVFWGGVMDAVDVLYFLRDHDILHVGWNLALMDHLNVPRFESLVQYWGP